MIPATKPFLPDIETYKIFVDGIWARHWVTNNGPLVEELEAKISAYLGVSNLSFVSSGTMGLQLALHSLPYVSLGLRSAKREIITTPFSYVATTSSIVWEGFTPVFADILPGKMTIDPAEIEKLITSNTVAILATHIYGNACEVEEIETLAATNGLKVIYDAAHCFGSTYKGKSLLDYGDYSVLSTHATKIFHTVNGGFVRSKSAEEKERIDRLRNFGHNGVNHFEGIGINGKNSELHAAMGLAILPEADALLGRRKEQWNRYAEAFKNSKFKILELQNPEGFNHAYFPIILPSKDLTTEVELHFQKNSIELRRYFNPGLNTLDYVQKTECPVSDDLTNRILCLPLYHDLSRQDQDRITTELLHYGR